MTTPAAPDPVVDPEDAPDEADEGKVTDNEDDDGQE